MPKCRVCRKPCLKRDGGNYLIDTHCSRFCYEVQLQGLQKLNPSELTTNCVFCGNKMVLNRINRTINAWLCSNECNTLKFKAYGPKSHKKFLVLLHLQLFGKQTASQLAEKLNLVVPRWRYNSHTICQLLRSFVVNSSVIQHKHPTKHIASVYEISGNLPLEHFSTQTLSG
jgi:hypothetical protein